MPRKISVFGLGKVGFPFAVCWASGGFDVIAFDVREEILESLSRGKNPYPYPEPSVDALLRRARSRISVAKEGEEAALGSDASFVVVPTPSEPHGGYSTEYVEEALKPIARAIRKKDSFYLVTVVSTLVPGSMEGVVKPLLEGLSGKGCGVDFGLCYNPEFIALGSVVNDLLVPDMVLIGESDSRSGTILSKMYKKFCKNHPPISRMSLQNAELAKLSLNVYMTMKITFANNLAGICERMPGGNIEAISRTLGLDSRIGGKYLNGGLSYGGPCFPRDNRAFSHFAEQLRDEARMSKLVDEINRDYNSRVVQTIMGEISDLERPSVSLLGLTYKPDTDVVEEAASLGIACSLVKLGARVTAYDPAGIPKAREVLGDTIEYAKNIGECVADSDSCVVATPWDEFKTISPSFLIRKMRHARVLDCWRILDRDAFLAEPKVSYRAIGMNFVPHDR